MSWTTQLSQIAAPAGPIDWLAAGGLIGYLILLLAVVAAVWAVIGFVTLTRRKLVPDNAVKQFVQLASDGKFLDLLNAARAHDSMIGRVVADGMAQGNNGLNAIRETMQESGRREITRLHQRVGWLGYIGSAAPMLGLLGTVIGMMGAFAGLGDALGSPVSESVNNGVARALVTTALGIALAIPVMIVNGILRDRVVRLGQDASGACERILQHMNVVIETRNLHAAARGARVPASDAGNGSSGQTTAAHAAASSRVSGNVEPPVEAAEPGPGVLKNTAPAATATEQKQADEEG